MKILQINVTSNTGSTGRITEEIGEHVLSNSGESYIAYSRKGRKSSSKTIKIGSKSDVYLHVLISRLFDKHGFASNVATKKLIRQIEVINPDLIHLHNIHGYFVNIHLLFLALERFQKPVFWTLHDCWPFTGHCAHFEDINCEKWKKLCKNCPKTNSYPRSWWIDNSKSNYEDKKRIFTSLKNLTLITPSNWLQKLVKESFLNFFPSLTIYNGVDLERFKPIKNNEIRERWKLKLSDKIILGVASIWTGHRGLKDFIELNGYLSETDFKIVLVGLSEEQLKNLPSSIIGIKRTEEISELVNLYSIASIYVNPTYSDTFPTTNIEALACGTPVLTYDTGGSPEAIDEFTGRVVIKGDVKGLLNALREMILDIDAGRRYLSSNCRYRAELLFDKNDRFNDYVHLYEKILTIN